MSVHFMNKGSKFLKKLWCFVGGGVQQGNSVLSTALITEISHSKEFKSRFFEHQPFQITLTKASCSKHQLLNSLQRPIYVINSVDNTKLPCYTPYGCLLSTEHVERTIILFLSIELPVVYHKLKYWILHAENFISNMPHILYWKLHNLMFTVLCLLCLFAYITYSFVQHPYTYCVVRNLAIKTSSFHGKQQYFQQQ